MFLSVLLVFNFKYLNTKKGSQTCGVKINRETKKITF